MKSRSTYRTSIPAMVLLCIYLLNPLKLALPYLEYRANYDYIVKFLCENKDKPEMNCNGKCHLAKTLKGNQEKESNQQRIIPKNYQCDELPNQEILFNRGIRLISNIIVPYISHQEFIFSETFTPPPQSIV